MLGAWPGGSIKQSGKKRISLGAGEKRGSKGDHACSVGVISVYSAPTSRSCLDLVWFVFVGIVGKFDSEVSVESSAHERERSGCCRDSIMVTL